MSTDQKTTFKVEAVITVTRARVGGPVRGEDVINASTVAIELDNIGDAVLAYHGLYTTADQIVAAIRAAR